MLDVIEKEAKLTGAYQQDRKNDADAEEMAKRIVDRLTKAKWTPEEVDEFIKSQYPEISQQAM